MSLRRSPRELLLDWAEGTPGQRPAGWRVVAYRSACRRLHRLGLPGRPGQPATPLPRPLDRMTLQAHFGERLQIDLRWHCRSTLDGWRRWLRTTPLLVVSESQSGGRGRQGRRWRSALTGNLYLSLVTPVETTAAIGLLPLLCGLAVAECLDASGLNASLKWPNDVLLDGRKLAGVLIELDSSRRPWRAAIGIGLNWHLPDHERRQIDRASTDLYQALGAALPERESLLIALVERLLATIAELREGDPAGLLRRWQARDALRDVEIELVSDGRRLRGLAQSVDQTGRLRLRNAAGTQLLSAGEVERLLPREDPA